MSIKLPEDLSKVELDELATLSGQITDRAAELLGKDDAELSDDELNELEELSGYADKVDAEGVARQTAADERTAKVAAVRERLAKAPAEDEDEPAAKADEPVEEVEELPAAAAAEAEALATEIPDDASALVDEKEPVVAAANRATALRNAAMNKPAAPAPTEKEKPMFSLIAAGENRSIAAGSEFKDFDGVISAFGEKLDGFTAGSGNTSVQNRFPIARLQRDADPETTLSIHSSPDEVSAAFKAAIAKHAMPQSTDALVASGGWAAPSQILYDIPIVEEAPDGLLSLPSITVQRGGFQHTLGVDYSTISTNANFGFTQTETQAAAKTVKPFIEPTDPTFIDERLQVIGYGMRAGFLTLQGYPELIKRHVSGSTVAFAHYKNKDLIARLLASGTWTSTTAAAIGSVAHDLIDHIALQANRLRYKYMLKRTTTFEGMAPFWLLDVIREDLAKRQGWDAIMVTDQYINGLLASRGISLQWVRDWTAQDLSISATAYPASAQVALWKSGTFVAGGGPVVNFDAVYDYDGISKNTYTAFFHEESVLVAKMLPIEALVITVPTTSIERQGRTGKDDLGFTGVTARAA